MIPNGVTTRKVIEALNQQGIHPTDEQLAEATGYQPEQIHNRLFLMRGDVICHQDPLTDVCTYSLYRVGVA